MARRSERVGPPLALALLPLLACTGAEGTPAPPTPAPPAYCGSLEELAPTLSDLANGTESSAVGALVETLQTPTTDGREPLQELLRTLVLMLGDFSRDPPENGGAPCATRTPPEDEPRNRACMVRRLIDPALSGGVAEAEARQREIVAAIERLLPLVSGGVRYVTGELSRAYDEDGDGDSSHYALVDVLRRGCGSDGVCSTARTVELLRTALEYLTLPTGGVGGCADPASHGERFLCRAESLVLDPDFLGPGKFWESLDFDGNRPGFVALLRIVTLAILEAPSDPARYFDEVQAQLDLVRMAIVAGWPNGTLPASWDGLTEELRLILHPERGVLEPAQDLIGCLRIADRQAKRAEEERLGRPMPEGPLLLLALHSMLFAEPVAPMISLPGVLADVKAVLATDRDGLFVAVGLELLRAIEARSELFDTPTSPLNAACRTVLDRESAARTLPMISDLLGGTLLEETFCVVDVLVYGCIGGTRPSLCASPLDPP